MADNKPHWLASYQTSGVRAAQPSETAKRPRKVRRASGGRAPETRLVLPSVPEATPEPITGYQAPQAGFGAAPAPGDVLRAEQQVAGGRGGFADTGFGAPQYTAEQARAAQLNAQPEMSPAPPDPWGQAIAWGGRQIGIPDTREGAVTLGKARDAFSWTPVGAIGEATTGVAQGDYSGAMLSALGAIPAPGEKAAAEAAPIFYSALERAIASGPAKAPAGQWLATLKNAGVKNEEMEWTGLYNFLTGQAAEAGVKPQAVTKSDLLKHLQDNAVQVQTKVLGGAGEAAEVFPLPQREAARQQILERLPAWREQVNFGTSPTERALSDSERQNVSAALNAWVRNGDPDHVLDIDRAYPGLIGGDIVEAYTNAPAAAETKWGPDRYPDLSLPGGPLSRDTEILTDAGWRRMDEVAVGDIVLTRADGSGSLEWQPVQAVPTVWADTLLHFKSQSIDMMVTKNHQMVVRKRRRSSAGEFRVTAGKLWTMAECIVPLTGKWGGGIEDSIAGLDAGDVAELVGWHIAEGSVGKSWNNKKSNISISQSRTANPWKCDRLEALFGRLGIGWSYYPSGTAYYLKLRSMPRALINLLYRQGTSAVKHVPRELFAYRQPILDRLLEALLLGDGSRSSGKGNRQPRWTFHSKSRQLADDVQVLALLTGKRSGIRRRKSGLYEVGICLKAWSSIDDAKRGEVPYNDTAYCVTVENHAIYVRRNGIAAFTGNSNNYREMLLTLPTKPLAEPSPENLRKTAAEMYGERFVDRLSPAQWDLVKKKLSGGYRQDNFTGSHHDEPNVLAHVRMNDRTDAEGKKVLFLEEVQSDWAKKGRKHGFIQPDPYKYDKDRLDSLNEKLKSGAGLTKPEQDEYRWMTDYEAFPHTRAKERQFQVPQAPFIGGQGWHDLAMKRVLRYAAENNYDRVAWTTGKQQAERYPNALRQVADRIEWTPPAMPGEPRLVTVSKGAGTVAQFYINDAGVILPGRGLKYSQRDAVDKPLSDVIGDSMAARVMGAPEGKITGEEFTVGGKGYEDLYDKQFPQAMNRLAKKWGGKTGRTNIQTAVGYKGNFSLRDPQGGSHGLFSTREEAEAALRDPAQGFRGYTVQGFQGTPPITPPVHAIDLNDAARQHILQGFPLFKRGGAVMPQREAPSIRLPRINHATA